MTPKQHALKRALLDLKLALHELLGEPCERRCWDRASPQCLPCYAADSLDRLAYIGDEFVFREKCRIKEEETETEAEIAT